MLTWMDAYSFCILSSWIWFLLIYSFMHKWKIDCLFFIRVRTRFQFLRIYISLYCFWLISLTIFLIMSMSVRALDVGIQFVSVPSFFWLPLVTNVVFLSRIMIIFFFNISFIYFLGIFSITLLSSSSSALNTDYFTVILPSLTSRYSIHFSLMRFILNCLIIPDYCTLFYVAIDEINPCIISTELSVVIKTCRFPHH